MAFMVRALALAVDDPGRQARSLTMHFLRAPSPGPIRVGASVERAGRSLTSVSGRLEQDGKLIGLALGAYSVPWSSPHLEGAPMPAVDPPDARRPIADEFPRDGPPAFTGKLSMQHRFGEPPWSSADRGLTGGWLGLREERELDALSLCVLADAWFPAPWPRLKALAPAPTIDLTVHFRAPLPLPDDLVLGRFESQLVRDGFFEEDGEMWTPDGTLAVQSRQLGLLLDAQV